MRDFTKQELALWQDGKCPGCGKRHAGYRVGPRGGITANMLMECGTEINAVEPDSGFPCILGQILSKPPHLPDLPPFSWWQRLLAWARQP